jgi:hypothetical protein
MTRSRILVASFAAILVLVAAPAALAAAPGTPDLMSTSDSGALNTDNITSDTTPDFSIDAGVANTGQIVTLCIIDSVSSGTPIDFGSTVVPSSGSVTITASSALLNATYLVTAHIGSSSTCNLASGERSESALFLTIDTTPPTLTAAPELLSVVGSDDTVTFNATPRLAVFAESNSTVTLYEGTAARGTGKAVAGIAYINVTPPLSDGTHTLGAKATDLAGNTSALSPTVTFSVDASAPTVAAPDLIDDDGTSSSDNYTSFPRPRFTVATESNAYVTLYEGGIALGYVKADSGGLATVAVREDLWLDPGSHCLYAIATDAVGNASAPSTDLCITVAPGVPPFTSNLGVTLTGEFLSMALRASAPVSATIRVLVKGKVVLKAHQKVVAGKTAKVGVKLPARARGARKLVVIATLRSAGGDRVVIRRIVRR